MGLGFPKYRTRSRGPPRATHPPLLPAPRIRADSVWNPPVWKPRVLAGRAAAQWPRTALNCGPLAMPPAATTAADGNAIAQEGVARRESSDSSSDAGGGVIGGGRRDGAAVLFVLFARSCRADRRGQSGWCRGTARSDTPAMVELTEPVGAVALVVLGEGVEPDDVVAAGGAIVVEDEVGTAATISRYRRGFTRALGPGPVDDLAGGVRGSRGWRLTRRTMCTEKANVSSFAPAGHSRPSSTRRRGDS